MRSRMEGSEVRGVGGCRGVRRTGGGGEERRSGGNKTNSSHHQHQGRGSRDLGAGPVEEREDEGQAFMQRPPVDGDKVVPSNECGRAEALDHWS